MKREEIQNNEIQIQHLLYLSNTLIDESTYRRTISVSGATVSSDGICVSNNKQFAVPYSNDIVKWNTNGFTIEMDCYCTTSITGYNWHGTFVLNGNNPGGVDYWSFGITKQKLTFYYYSGTQRNVTGSTAVSLNEWHNIKMNYSNGLITIYLDGTEEISAAVIGTPQFSSYYPLRFMAYTSTVDVILKNIKIYMQ